MHHVIKRVVVLAAVTVSACSVSLPLAAGSPAPVPFTIRLAVGTHPITAATVDARKLERSRQARASLVRRLGTPACETDAVRWDGLGVRILLYMVGSVEGHPKLGPCELGFLVAVQLYSDRAVVRTDFGQVRVGNRWRALSPGLRRRAERDPGEDNEAGTAWAWGRTDPCGSGRLLSPTKFQPVMTVWVGGGGRVTAIKLHEHPFDLGAMCESP